MTYSELSDICDQKRILLKNVAENSGLTYDGLRNGMNKQSLGMTKILKICEYVGITPNHFFGYEPSNTINAKEPWLWLACEILYYCAIRPGTEMRLLKVGDIDFNKKTICIRAELAKNKTTETVLFPYELLEHMLSLNVHMYDKNLYLFGKYGTPSACPMGKNTMRNRFNHYRELLHISEDKKFYSWKHSGALSAIDNGATIYDVKDQLRHKSIMTTEEYLKKRVPKSGVAAEKMDKI